MNVVIIEDEEIAVEKLEGLIKRARPDANVLARLDSVKSAVAWLNANPSPDLMFMDIQLADGISFDIFKQATVTCPIIFTTAYDEYAVKAFQLNSIDYLLKPIRPEEVQRAVDKYHRLWEAREQQPPLDVDALLKAIAPQKQYKQRFLVKLGQKIRSVPAEEIAYFFAEDKLVFLISHDGSKMPVDYSLDQLDEMLDPARFFKANRQFLISMESIAHIYPYSNSRIKVNLKPVEPRELIISNDKAPVFKTWLDS
ncbi:MAG: LytTR family DNA-binding domain-containing protein [Bacteroidota bacterium]